ncbi:MAG: hypothetical protein R3F29_05170 [Planctomycetota bacterium]
MKSITLRYLAPLALLTAPIAAQGIVPYLPKGTMMMVSAPDLSMSVAEFAQMPLAKMWAEEEVQTFVGGVREMLIEKLDEGMAQAKEMHAQGALPVDPDELMKLRIAGGTFALTHMELTHGDFGPMPKMGMVLHLDFGDSAPTWNSLIQMGLGMMEGQAGDKVEKNESMVGDVKLLTFAPTRARGLEMSLNIAMVPNGLLIGTLTDEVRGIVESMQAGKAQLTESEIFSATTKGLDVKGSECQMFMSPTPMVDFALSALRMAVEEESELQMIDMDGVERALQAMGMRDLGSVGVTSSYVDGKCVTRSYHAKGKGGTAAPKTIDTSFLKWVPKDAVSFGAGTMDFADIYDTMVKGLQAYDADLAQQMLGQLAEIEKQVGVNLRADLFGAIGDHYITWSMPMGTISSMPETALLVKVNDQEKLVSAMKNLAAMTQGMVEIDEGTKRGIDAYQVQINFDPTGGRGGFNPFELFQPAFSFKDGYMVVAFSASDIKRVFKRMDREDDPKGDIRGNKEFAAIAAQIPSGVDSLSFTDWKANFESLYQVGTGLLAFVPVSEDIPIDMSMLPDSETLTRHLFASLTYSKSDGNGTSSTSVSPFGPETMLGLAVLVGVGAGTAAFVGARGGF